MYGGHALATAALLVKTMIQSYNILCLDRKCAFARSMPEAAKAR